MRIPGLKTLKQTGRWIGSRFRKHALILGYHRIADEPFDPYHNCVKPAFFAEHLEVIKTHCYPVRLSDLVQGFKNQDLPRRAVALTFDDGYVDALTTVKPLLEKHRIPAAVFVTTGCMGDHFWWDELAGLVWSFENISAGIHLDFNGRRVEWEPAAANGNRSGNYKFNSREKLLQFLYSCLRDLPDRERQEALLGLTSFKSGEFKEYELPQTLSPEEVVQLARGEFIEVGAHTVTHPALARLPEEEQRCEIQQSKSSLEKLLGASVNGFSYPNGSSSNVTRALVQASGYQYACASTNGVVWSGSDPYHLPRFWVPDWDGAAFSKWLFRWLDE